MQKPKLPESQQRGHMADKPFTRGLTNIAVGLICVFVAGLGAAVGYWGCHG